MSFRPSTGTSLYYLTEPNGNVAGATDPFGYLVATYQYSPYGKTSTTGLGQFNPFRYLSAWQETNANGDPGHYKLGARFYNTNGMFTQPDALSGNLGDPRTMTSCNYAGGDPINQADASGLSFTAAARFADASFEFAGAVLDGQGLVEALSSSDVVGSLRTLAISYAVGSATTFACGSIGAIPGLLGAPATGGASVLGVAVTCGTLGIAAGEFTTKLLEE